MEKNYVIKASLTTVADVMELLKELPQDAKFYCCGLDEYHLNVDVTKNTVTVDTENFNDYYGVGEW